ncbi:hypothetical protein H0H87_006502 [Tephrocybe sp. NHM501043]|nr:hypothetical protein H0H87_006502 [Tephrocybe sp. NHM501043]
MGFFSFFEHAPQHGLSKFTTTPSKIPAVGHDVSFDLTTTRTLSVRCDHLTSHPSPIPLPLEIVINIIEEASYSDGTPDQDLLRQCALVCRAWSLPAQKLLFSSVTLRSQLSCNSFSKAVTRSTPKGRVLGDTVVRMRAVIDHNQPFKLSQRSLAEAVTQCPNLYELNLSLYGRASPRDNDVGVSRMRRPAPSFDEGTLTLLRSGPTISALQFSNWSENSQSLTQLLDVWPSLRSLAISGTPPEPPSPFLAPFPGSLDELRMNFQSPPSLEFVNWLLHNSAESLRAVEFEREPSTQLLQAFTDAYGANLHSLTIPSCHLPEHTRAVQTCQQLRELRIESPTVSPRLWRGLPKTLEHIALGIDLNTALQPLIDAVRASRYLGSVTVHFSNDGEKHSLFPVLKMACAYQGVELSAMYDIKLFRSQLRGDPVPTLAFPRTRSLKNIYIMRS